MVPRPRHDDPSPIVLGILPRTFSATWCREAFCPWRHSWKEKHTIIHCVKIWFLTDIVYYVHVCSYVVYLWFPSTGLALPKIGWSFVTLAPERLGTLVFTGFSVHTFFRLMWSSLNFSSFPLFLFSDILIPTWQLTNVCLLRTLHTTGWSSWLMYRGSAPPGSRDQAQLSNNTPTQPVQTHDAYPLTAPFDLTDLHKKLTFGI